MNLKRSLTLWGVLAVLCIVALSIVACSKSGDEKPNPTPNPPTPNPPAPLTPTITSFVPTNASTDATVVITGTNFTGATTVTFGGTAAKSFTVTNATTITAIVGNGASGNIVVTTPTGNVGLPGFTYIPPAGSPAITGLNSMEGTIGSIITIKGDNFNGTTAVNFGISPAVIFKVVDNNTIVAQIGLGSSGNVTVTNAVGSTSFPNFRYVASNASTGKLISSPRGIGLGFPRFVERQKTTGTVKVAVVFVDFSDAPSTRTPQKVFELVSPGGEKFLSTISYDKLNLVFEPKFKWYRMSKPTSAYFNSGTFVNFQEFLQEAASLADPEVNFSDADQLLIITNPDGGDIPLGPTFIGSRAYGINTQEKVFANAIGSGKDLLFWKEYWFPHEFGHSMGLPDLYPYTQPNNYVGDWSMMGNIFGFAPEYSAYERWYLNWLADAQVRSVTVNGQGTIDLTPIENEGGMKLLILPLDQSRAILVEDRRDIGYDKAITKEGPVVYFIDANIDSGMGVLKVLSPNGNNEDARKSKAALAVGESITYGNITVKCVASGPEGSTIEYERKP